MVDTSKCFSLVRGRVMRVTQLDGCGAKVLGPTAQIVSDGFISVALAAQTDAGTEISVTNAAGNVCILDSPCPKFTGYEVTIEFCGVDPDLYRLLTGQTMELDGDGLGVGFRMNTGVDACATGFALELWSNVPSAACAPGSGVSYGYFLIPFLKGGIIGDFTIANDAVNFTLTGAKSKDGSAWGVGPYNVVKSAIGADSPLLVAVDPKDHLVMELTPVAPPVDAGCGAQPLGVPATSAVAGIPATYSPVNSYGRATFALMTGLTASPSTAWTTGQYALNRDGSKGYWNGTAWVAGVAP